MRVDSHTQIRQAMRVDIGVFFQLLRIVHDVVFAFGVLRNALTDGNKQGTGAASRIVNFNFLSVFQMVSHNFRHKLRYFVWGIKLTGLFTSIGRKVTDQVFINKAQNIIILFAIGRDIFDYSRISSSPYPSFFRRSTSLSDRNL